MARTADQVRTDLLNQYSRLVPQLDLGPGSVERDVFIEAPLAGALVPMWKSIEVLESVYDLFANADNIPATTLDEIATGTFNVQRTPATPATGTVTFYTSAFNEAIVIPAGTRVQTTASSPRIFYTLNSGSFTPLDAPIYFNAVTQRYEFRMSVRSQNLGQGNAVGKGAITVLISPISGISGVVNESAITDGSNSESNAQLVSKIKLANLSRNIDTTSGIAIFLSQYSTDYSIVKYGDKDFTRSKFPGARDVYFTDVVEEAATQTFVVPSNAYTGSFVPEKQPVLSISSIIGDVSGILPTTSYALVKDTGILSGSIKAKDAISILSPGINDTSIVVNYSYNSFPESIHAELANPSNDTLNRDILIRQGETIPVTVTMKVRLSVGSSIDTVSNDISIAIAEYVDSLGLGDTIVRESILTASRVSGVLAIDYTSFVIEAPGASEDQNGDFMVKKSQYGVFVAAEVTELI